MKRSSCHREGADAATLRHSAIYEGVVTHHRRHPVTHRFTYRLFHLYLDLAELPTLFTECRWWRYEASAPAVIRRRDHLPGPSSLAEQARDLVQARTGHRPEGAVRLLTQPRMFGVSFNPVSFFYCFAEDGSLEAIIAEITNIPWLERHQYVLDCRGRPADALEFDLGKVFHISPFMGMDQRYRWRFTVPGAELGVHMTTSEDGRELFTAALEHRHRALTPSALDGLLWRYPFMPLQVVAGIYAQAARLWWKDVPVFTHPAQVQSAHRRSPAPAPGRAAATLSDATAARAIR